MQIKTYISLLQVLIVVLVNDVKKKSVLKKKVAVHYCILTDMLLNKETFNSSPYDRKYVFTVL